MLKLDFEAKVAIGSVARSSAVTGMLAAFERTAGRTCKDLMPKLTTIRTFQRPLCGECQTYVRERHPPRNDFVDAAASVWSQGEIRRCVG